MSFHTDPKNLAAFNLLLNAERTTTVAFNPEWANGTGYFDNATRDASLPTDRLLKAVEPNGRRLLLIPMAAGGHLVLFDRYSDRQDCLVYNVDASEASPIEVVELNEMDIVEFILQSAADTVKYEDENKARRAA